MVDPAQREKDIAEAMKMWLDASEEKRAEYFVKCLYRTIDLEAYMNTVFESLFVIAQKMKEAGVEFDPPKPPEGGWRVH